MTALGRHLASLPPHVFATGLARLSNDDRKDALKARFRYDQEHFIKWLWPQEYSRPFARYHTDILRREKEGWRERAASETKTLRALAAPRSTSKTGITCATLAHDVLHGLEAVVPILSAEKGLSRQSLATIRQLLSADTVTELYGQVTFKGGVDRFTATTADGHSCTFIAKSFGTSVRGLKEGMIRPTRLIVDDGEDKHKVRNPDIRREWWDFLVADILKLGDIAGGLIVDWLGTVLHPDAVLARLLDAAGDGAGWEAERYQACEVWPNGPRSAALWQECGSVWATLECEGPWFDIARAWHDGPEGPPKRRVSFDRLKPKDRRHFAAWCFYLAHKADMDEGARMLSDDWISLFAFHETIWNEGMGSVLKELQNEPRDEATAIFRSETFPRCRVVSMPDGEPAVQRLRRTGPQTWEADGNPVRRRDLRVTLRLDPIPADDLGGIGGGAGGSDFAAIAAIGRDQHDRGYVLDLWMARATDTQQIAALWQLAEKWRAARAVIEANGFQRLLGKAFRRSAEERAAAGLYCQLPVAKTEDSVSTTNKNEDIATLEPVLTNGWLYFAEHIPKPALAQFDAWPNGEHDDGPDVVARGWRDSQLRGAVGAVGSFGR